MVPATLDVTPNVDAETAADLYRHAKRPEWGLAIMVREDGTSLSYQFEDGRLRKIRKDYNRLMEPVDEFDAPEMIRTTLTRAIAEAMNDTSRSPLKPVAPFSDQVGLFLQLYPKGFQDPQWIQDHRGEPDETALKRHRDPVLVEAKEILGEKRCETMLSEGRQVELADGIIEMLGGTTLVPISHVKLLRRLEDEEKVRYAESVVDLLYGEEHFSRRFRAYLNLLEKLLGGRPSWRVATAIPAIVHPQKHVSVRRTAFKRQAGVVAPSARYTRAPKVGAYRNYRRVAMGVKKRLVEAGHEPRDLLDVHDFIWATLRKSALEHLGADDD